MSKGRIKGGQPSEKNNCFFPFGGQMCAVIIAVQFSLWTGTGAAVEPQPFSAKVPNALPMHCRYTPTAKGVRMQSTLVHSLQSCLAMKWPARGFDLPWIAIEKSFVLSSHICPLWIAREKRIAIVPPNRRNRGLPLKSHLFCARPQSSKEQALHTRDDSK